MSSTPTLPPLRPIQSAAVGQASQSQDQPPQPSQSTQQQQQSNRQNKLDSDRYATAPNLLETAERNTTAQQSSQQRRPVADGLVVTLENFDEHAPVCNINSPRSLEAIEACGLDPSQLLAKPLEHFSKKYGPELAANRAFKYEKRRQECLADARSYRNALIQAELRHRALRSSRSTSPGRPKGTVHQLHPLDPSTRQQQQQQQEQQDRHPDTQSSTLSTRQQRDAAAGPQTTTRAQSRSRGRSSERSTSRPGDHFGSSGDASSRYGGDEEGDPIAEDRKHGENAIMHELRRAEAIKRRRIRELRMRIASEIRREMLIEEARRVEEKQLADQRAREQALAEQMAAQRARQAAELEAERARERERERLELERAMREAAEAALRAEQEAAAAEERRIRAEERLRRRQEDQRRRQMLIEQLRLAREHQREEKERQIQALEEQRKAQLEQKRQEQARRAQEQARLHAEMLKELERKRELEMQERLRKGLAKERQLRRRQERVARRRAEQASRARAEFEAKQQAALALREQVEEQLRLKHEAMLERERQAAARREAFRQQQQENIERSRRAESEKCKERAQVFDAYSRLLEMRRSRLLAQQQAYEERLAQNRAKQEKARALTMLLRAEQAEERQEHLKMVERMQEYRRKKIEEKIEADRQRIERMEAERQMIRARVAAIVKRSEEGSLDDTSLLKEMLSSSRSNSPGTSTSRDASADGTSVQGPDHASPDASSARPQTTLSTSRRKGISPDVIARVAERMKIPEELAREIAETMLTQPRPVSVGRARSMKPKNPEESMDDDYSDDADFDTPPPTRVKVPPLRTQQGGANPISATTEAKSAIRPAAAGQHANRPASQPCQNTVQLQPNARNVPKRYVLNKPKTADSQSKPNRTQPVSTQPPRGKGQHGILSTPKPPGAPPRAHSRAQAVQSGPSEEQWNEVDALEQAQNQHMQRLIAQEEARERDRQSMLATCEGPLRLRLMAMFQSERQQAAAYLQSVLRQHQLALAAKLEEIGIYEGRPELPSTQPVEAGL